MSKSSIASLALGGAALLLSLGSASAAVFPNIGEDTNGPALIITLNPGGSGTITPGGVGSAGIPYDGVEDTYIGLINNSGQLVTSIVLSAPVAVGIFGFDGDGVGAPVGGVYPGPGFGTNQYGTPNANDVTGPCIGSGCSGGGYGGPLGSFSGLFTSAGFDFGTFTIAGGLAAGGFTWFSLEEPLTEASFTAQVGSTTPIPAALPLFASGLGALGLIARRRKRKAAAAIAAA